MHRFLAGSASGSLATIPMTAFMMAGRKLLPAHQQYELPPRTITREVAETATQTPVHDEHELTFAATLAHLGYGAAMGATYALWRPRRLRTAMAGGVAFGLVVWAKSYLGWLPALDVSAAATREPPERNALVVGAHVVWGATLGALYHRLARS